MILLDTGMRKMPDKCSECNFFRVESQMYCTAVVGYTTVSKPRERRPAWCPLHEVTDSDTISRQAAYDTLTEYYHHKTDIQHKALAEALSRVPSTSRPTVTEYTDTISRKQAIDALFEIIDRPKHAEFLYTDEIHRALSNLPPSPSRPQWIPCSERLPEEEVLCCDTRGEMIIGYPYQDEESNTGYSAVLDDIVMIDCTACMPLPEPYRP